jgi:hypothetical protein
MTVVGEFVAQPANVMQIAVTEHDRFGCGSVMVWSRIRITGMTDLHVIAQNLTGIGYRDEILYPIVRLYAGAIGDNFISMDVNARPRRARVVTDHLENEITERMD